MDAKNFKFEVNDTVCIEHGWGEHESAIIIHIPDGSVIDEITLLFEDDSTGAYRPEDCHSRHKNPDLLTDPF